MHRRAYLAVSGSVLVAGCSQVEQLSSGLGSKSLGETATFGEIEVTVTDSMTSEQFTLNGNEKTSPGNGIYALFHVEAYNTDVTKRDGPLVNPDNYDTLEEEEGTIHMAGVNDIRVYGDGEGGHFPDVDWSKEYGWEEQDDGTIVAGGELTFSVDDEELEPYPTGMTRPSIEPDSMISGWVIGVIDADATPELRINFDGTSETWTADG